jgi:hypothetical protein
MWRWYCHFPRWQCYPSWRYSALHRVIFTWLQFSVVRKKLSYTYIHIDPHWKLMASIVVFKVQIWLPFSENWWHRDCGWQSCGAIVQACFPSNLGPVAFLCRDTLLGWALFIYIYIYVLVFIVNY